MTTIGTNHRSRGTFGARPALALLAGVALAQGASAQDLIPKAPPQTAPVAIVGASIHTVSNGTVERGYVLFEGGLIVEVGDGERAFTATTRVIDAEGLHVYPGLIGAVTQTGLTEFGAVAATRDTRETGSITPEVCAMVAVNPDSTIIPVTRANGILTVGVFPDGGAIAGRAGVMRLDGWTWQDMAVREDAGLVVNWPFMRTVRAPWMNLSERDQQGRVREQVETISAAFDAAAAYARAREGDPALPVDVRWEAMRSVLPGEGQRPVFINAQDYDQITAAVTWAVDRGLKPVIIGGRDAPLCADLLVTHDVPVIVQGTHNMPKRDDSPYDDAFTLPARLEAAGIRWCLASGEETPHERSLPYHAATAVAFGLSREAAIRSITLSAADILGVGDSLGSIDPGKSATLIVTNGDPLEITTETLHAFIDGREINLASKHKALDAKYREKYRQLGGGSAGQ